MDETFLERMVRWMKRDVQVCMDNDAYVGAMRLMMSDVSALAGFYGGRTKPTPRDAGSTDEKEFMSFFDSYFPILNALPHSIILKPLKGTKVKNLIYTDFRCGLIHEHLMKSGTAIDKRVDRNYLYLTQAGITININMFHEDYLKTIEEYRLDVANDRKPPIKAYFIARAEYLGAFTPHC